MISAFKRLVHTNNGQTSGDKHNDKKLLSAGVQPMDSSLQKKFSKGVQYNMKIIIRGDKNVGKTCLFQRLQGNQFEEEYKPTEEIQVTNIEWNYNVTDDKVKVEIWEICDVSSKKRKPVNELKLNEKKKSKASTFEEEEVNELGLDAQFVDVYKNTNGAILVFDLTKSWTFDYIEKEIKNIPPDMPVIILGNHIDQGHHGLPVNKDKVKSFIETIERENSGQIRYAETSMRNGFGLKLLYKWFNLPFLHLKQQTLLKQIQTNEREMSACCLELSAIEESDDQNYERFLYTIQNRRREMADKLSQVPKSFEKTMVSKSIPFDLAAASSNMTANQMIKPTPSIIIGANNPLPIPKNYSIPQSKSSFTVNNHQTTLANNSKSSKDDKNEIQNESEDQIKLRQFLEDAIETHDDTNKQSIVQQDDSDDEELNQPTILGYQDELDPEDCIEEPSSLVKDIKQVSISSKVEIDKSIIQESVLENGVIKSESNEKMQKNDQRKKSSKKESNKATIDLINNLPDKSILEKSHLSSSSSSSSKTNRSKKSHKKTSDKTKLSKKKSHNLEDLLGPSTPYISGIDEGPNADDEYFEL